MILPIGSNDRVLAVPLGHRLSMLLLLLVLLGPLARLRLTRQGDSFVFVATAPSMVPAARCSLGRWVLSQCGMVMAASAWLHAFRATIPHTHVSSGAVSLNPGGWGGTRFPGSRFFLFPLMSPPPRRSRGPSWSSAPHPVPHGSLTDSYAVCSRHFVLLGSSEFAARHREHRGRQMSNQAGSPKPLENGLCHLLVQGPF